MPLKDAELGKILVELSYLSEEDLKNAEEQSKDRNIQLKYVLLELGLLTPDLLESALAEYYKLPFADLINQPPTPETVNLLPEEIARTYSVIVLSKTDDSVKVATSEPQNAFLEEAIRLNIGQEFAMFPEKEDAEKKKMLRHATAPKVVGKNSKEPPRPVFGGAVEMTYAPRVAIEALFVHYRKPLATRFQQIINEQKRVAPEIITEIFNDALELRASDIHFEPQEQIVIVRFRVDGVMHVAGRLPREYYEGVVNRIKIAANMKIDEHFAAQDGAIRYEAPSGKTIDMRVSIVPTVDGEKIVLRILSEYIRTLTLNDLGFSEEYKSILEKVAHKPFGMILTTGPTGAGKSTTLYALLKMRNFPDVNISTIEDPVEYKIPGINHIQVNAETNLTFANGLRALVRQDPNIILVGEIRDGETAAIAVNAALTGHLLFSTLHANDAATAIPRLLEMGVEPFLLASTLEVIIGQRLVRRICPQCRFSYSLPLADAQKLFPGAEEYFPDKEAVRLYKGKGCDHCSQTGYTGRTGIYELLVVTPQIEELIIRRATSTEVIEAGRHEGLKLLFDDGFEKVKSGVTTIEELLRVAAPPSLLFATSTDPHAPKKKI